ncbi:MAG: metalloregulator ArsR/SmtB family transcription factor [Chloroflexi bacterium]|nr:metalloregulator ArsR/SmtB family transcription factor [Chloroflexota bacterium]MCI0576006.1 metalloregulator ArsR/SmtB family transcription factor [Chloroflexota bacterium]MCI0645130.1 metalloregulator ArsR/SmtB family transcription factor [Chloroflexota bacterium]MCI0726787.1 metalloregulator ArsR/SmtB family transcription factor [Chloroflexota bacterium]
MNASLENLADLFKALSDPTRLSILRMLTAECRPVSTIVTASGRSQPLISHHLRVLRESGLARTERKGTCIIY